MAPPHGRRQVPVRCGVRQLRASPLVMATMPLRISLGGGSLEAPWPSLVAGRNDYWLCVETPAGPTPLPVAILEAKKEDEDPLKGMQQAKGYSDCDRFDAKYIFSTNGHLYAKFNKFTGEQTGPFPLADFPDH